MDRAVRGRTPQKEVTAMNRTYEIMFIVRPDVDEAELDKLIETFSGYVTTGGGTIKQTEKMGRRRLAYTVRKFNDGFYVLLVPHLRDRTPPPRLRAGDQVHHRAHG
jgi:ribosomal protein S6